MKRADNLIGAATAETGQDGPARNVLPSHVNPPRALSLLCEGERAAPWLVDQLSLRELAALSKYLAVLQFAPGHVIMRHGQTATFVALVSTE